MCEVCNGTTWARVFEHHTFEGDGRKRVVREITEAEYKRLARNWQPKAGDPEQIVSAARRCKACAPVQVSLFDGKAAAAHD